MFLSNLNDTEKEVFCKLANIIACIDGVVPEELNSLSLYNREMGTNFSFVNNPKDSVDDLINQISKSSEKSKKIIAFELIGLAHADADYSQNEMKAVTEICFKLNIDPNKQRNMEKLVKNILEMYSEAAELLK